MRYTLSLSLALALCGSAAGVMAAAPAAPAQTSAQSFHAARNAWGQPDISGNWTNAFLTPLIRDPKQGMRKTYTPAEVKYMEDFQQENIAKGNAPVDNTKLLTDGVIKAHGGLGAGGNEDRAFLDPGIKVGRVDGQPRNSILSTPDGQVPPRKAGAPPAPTRQQAEILPDRSNGLFDNPEQLPLPVRCVMYGTHTPLFPNTIYNQNYEIVQTKDIVAIETEMIHDTRLVRLNAKHRTDGVRPYLGDSIGHWEGDTLVVETTNIPENQNIYGSWKNLTITEWFRRVGKDRLYYRFQIDDPTIWDKPWGGDYEFNTLNGRLMEYACAEGNYGMEGILAGARQQDAKEAAAKRQAAAGR
ncbi:MAG TPA: hypothetical protein VFN88_01870 [Caulobacteraceae bacterium]|nr:hypothetical protein [Caulobacteraceae bacterium]